jgi:outer membrane protein assembly factor BamB
MRTPLLFFCLGLPATLMAQTDWPQFRGPQGDGTSQSQNLPFEWSENKNVTWKTPVHGRAWSSPVALDGQVWLSTADEDGTELSAICLDLETGKVIHDLKLFDHQPNPEFFHRFNSHASPTPVIEPGRVYITFGSPGTACLDTKTGQVLWERRDLECNHFRGAGSSPILYGGLLIMHFDGSDHQYVAALNKETGETVWRTDRSIDFKDLGPDGKPELDGDLRKAYATPHVAQFNGSPLLISQGAKAAYGYDPLTGREYWRIEERSSHSAGTRPLVGHGLIFFPTGWSNGQLLAVRPDGKGDVTDSHVAWRVTRGVPKKPSLLLLDDLLFMVNDGGVAICLEAKTGKEVWSERVGGNYSASPLAAGGRIYFFSEEGKTTVIEAGRQFKKLGENHLEDGFMASPAVSGDALILRTRSAVYRIETAEE